MGTKEKVCTVCGRKYKPSSNNQKTCSKKCSKEHSRKRYMDYYWRNHERIRNYQNEWSRKQYGKNIDSIFDAFHEYLEETYE